MTTYCKRSHGAAFSTTLLSTKRHCCASDIQSLQQYMNEQQMKMRENERILLQQQREIQEYERRLTALKQLHTQTECNYIS